MMEIDTAHADEPQPRDLAIRPHKDDPLKGLTLENPIIINDDPASSPPDNSWAKLWRTVMQRFDWDAWFSSKQRRPLSTNVRERLMVYYHADLSIRTFSSSKAGFLCTNLDICSGVSNLDKVVNTLFVLYNISPILGNPINYVVAPDIRFVLCDSKDRDLQHEYSYWLDIYNLTNPERIALAARLRQMWRDARLLAESLETAPNVYIFGNMGGVYSSVDETEYVGHVISYVIDLKTKIFDIFDVNGQTSNYFAAHRNYLVLALRASGFTPFQPPKGRGGTLALNWFTFAKKAPVVKACTKSGWDMIYSTEGMVNHFTIEHKNTCGPWSLFYLWMRTTNSATVMWNLFNRIYRTGDDLDAFVTDVFVCCHRLFRACRFDLFRFGSGLDYFEALKVDTELNILAARGTASVLGISWTKPVISTALNVIFGCYKPNLVKTTLQECSPCSYPSIKDVFDETKFKLPWRYHISPEECAHTRFYLQPIERDRARKDRTQMLAARNRLAEDHRLLIKQEPVTF